MNGSRKIIKDVDIDIIDCLFRSHLRFQIVKDYPYSHEDCFFESITNLQYKSYGIPLDGRDRITRYSNALKQLAVDTVIVKLLELEGMKLQEVIDNMNGVKTTHFNCTLETPYQCYLELTRKPTREGGLRSRGLFHSH